VIAQKKICIAFEQGKGRFQFVRHSRKHQGSLEHLALHTFAQLAGTLVQSRIRAGRPRGNR
jgi:hypothetical protein